MTGLVAIIFIKDLLRYINIVIVFIVTIAIVNNMAIVIVIIAVNFILFPTTSYHSQACSTLYFSASSAL